MYIIRYATKNGGSGMATVKTNQAATKELLKLFKNRLKARVEINNTIIGEVYKQGNRWNWYIDIDA